MTNGLQLPALVVATALAVSQVGCSTHRQEAAAVSAEPISQASVQVEKVSAIAPPVHNPAIVIGSRRGFLFHWVLDASSARALYVKAIEASPRSYTGITAAWQFGRLLAWGEDYQASIHVLSTLLVEDEIARGPLGMEDVRWSPQPDYRRAACVAIADCFVKLKKYDVALTYLRLAQQKFLPSLHCGTCNMQESERIEVRIKAIEEAAAIARVSSK